MHFSDIIVVCTVSIYSFKVLFTRPRMGPSLGFVTNAFFFSVDLCYILWSVLLHHLICIAPLLELIAPLEFYCASVSQYYLSFKLSGKVVFFHLFCHLSFYFFAPAAFILELHRCSKGRSISRVQTENCYYFRNGSVLLLIVSELSSGLLPFKVRITIDRKSPNGKLYDR